MSKNYYLIDTVVCFIDSNLQRKLADWKKTKNIIVSTVFPEGLHVSVLYAIEYQGPLLLYYYINRNKLLPEVDVPAQSGHQYC